MTAAVLPECVPGDPVAAENCIMPDSLEIEAWLDKVLTGLNEDAFKRVGQRPVRAHQQFKHPTGCVVYAVLSARMIGGDSVLLSVEFERRDRQDRRRWPCLESGLGDHRSKHAPELPGFGLYALPANVVPGDWRRLRDPEPLVVARDVLCVTWLVAV